MEQKKMKGLENLFNQISENVPSLAWDLDIQIQEAQWSPGRYKTKDSLWHVIVRLSKDKEGILKTVKVSIHL